MMSDSSKITQFRISVVTILPIVKMLQELLHLYGQHHYYLSIKLFYYCSVQDQL
jgi:hypothetical protein